ncbi:two-component system, CitB family, response regulator CitT [Alteribacillus persepolensis]|uniref:Two-component system, CitB family, response regulator CitT n=1 Tax=Alteribacillus persepolensis TaxID=568899 RepID=A0A1G8C507_9BACI|nr:response regulator [Alteribacillus persepolensis]SDH40389.1 two-component system, CitB family, response regulator CitT [Alteribacillus persepolensis]
MIRTAIAEDDFRIASIHQELVNRVKGFQCDYQSLNAKDTLHMLEQHTIDLLLLDIFMPDELGTQLLGTIREHHPQVDILIISASTDVEHVQKSLRYGVFDYIIKPVSLERLEKTLQDYLIFHQQLHESKQVTQENIDRLTSIRSQLQPWDSTAETVDELPKGIDPLTLQTVAKELENAGEGMTAEEMGQYLGASRTTARRYLEYMISSNQADARPIYGIVGRPERRYFIRKKQS